MKPIPVGTLVDYHHGGRYTVTAHHCPHDLFPRNEWDEVKDHYPDGVAYEIWPEGMEIKFGNRQYSVYRVRRSSLTVIHECYPPGWEESCTHPYHDLCTREPLEPMDPFTEEI